MSTAENNTDLAVIVKAVNALPVAFQQIIDRFDLITRAMNNMMPLFVDAHRANMKHIHTQYRHKRRGGR